MRRRYHRMSAGGSCLSCSRVHLAYSMITHFRSRIFGQEAVRPWAGLPWISTGILPPLTLPAPLFSSPLKELHEGFGIIVWANLAECNVGHGFQSCHWSTYWYQAPNSNPEQLRLVLGLVLTSSPLSCVWNPWNWRQALIYVLIYFYILAVSFSVHLTWTRTNTQHSLFLSLSIGFCFLLFIPATVQCNRE